MAGVRPRGPLMRRRRGRRLADVWRMLAWPLFAAAVVAAFTLGYLGFDLHLGRAGGRSPTDLAYLSLQLFVLESGSIPVGNAPWQLEVARLLAPATTGVAIAAALLAAFRSEVDEIRRNRLRGHVVVCGLGAEGPGLVARLLDAGHRVVVVSGGGTTPIPCRPGAFVVEGDPRDPAVLGRARVDRAAHLLALSPSDEANAEIVLQASDLVEGRDGPPLRCLARIADSEFGMLLRARRLARPRAGRCPIDFVNVDQQAARSLLDEIPSLAGGIGRPAHLLVLGLTGFARALVVEMARRRLLVHDAGNPPPTVTVVDPDACAFADETFARLPGLAGSVDLHPIAAPPRGLDLAEVASPDRAVTTVVVCMSDGSAALETADRVRRRLGPGDTPVLAEIHGTPGLARLMAEADPDGIHLVDPGETTLRPEVLLGGVTELLARAIHAAYVEHHARLGDAPGSTPVLVPWDRLPESLRASNRDQAADLGDKLAAIGCGIAPIGDRCPEGAAFTTEEVERLAVMEHDRWVRDRVEQGWRPGSKDVERRTTPYLVPWSELFDEVREWDRRAVREIPSILARAGFQVVRGPELPPPASGTDQPLPEPASSSTTPG